MKIIEEKAKAYDELTAKLKEWHNGLQDGSPAKETLEYLLPQFRASEDEKIIKAIRLVLIATEDEQKDFYSTHGLTRKDCTNWLEKQKDASKAIEAVDRIDKYIDEYLANAHDMKDSNPDKKYYRGWDDALGKMAGILQDVYSDEKQKEQKSVWSEEDEKNSAFIVAALDAYARLRKEKNNTSGQEDFDKAVSWIHDRLGFIRPQPKQELDEESNEVVLKAVELLNRYGNSLYNENSEKANEVYKVADSLKLLSTQPKPEWSEEDERMFSRCVKSIESSKQFADSDTFKKAKDNEIDWLEKRLKSLRPSWKPSEEQICTLERICSNLHLRASDDAPKLDEIIELLKRK